jgi:ankyrin repeat protein
LPATLDETYERVLREIHKTDQEHSLRLLQCLAVAIRPLRVEELAEILAIDFDALRQNGIPKLNADWRWEDQREAVLSTCSSLVAIVDKDGSEVVQFSHFSMKEFLTSERLARSNRDISRYHIVLEPAHTVLAQACLGVLLRLDNRVDETNAQDTPLVEYAARYWVDHARFEDVSSRIRDAMEYFFDADKPHWAAWLRVYDMDKSWFWFEYSHQSSGSPLYYASLCGFVDLVEQLTSKHPEDVLADGGRMKTPLVAASNGKHLQIAEILHQRGADVNVRDDEGSPPLLPVSCDGLVDVAEWLFDHGADVNSQDNLLDTPLQLASIWGHFMFVRMLLKRKADVNMRGMEGGLALHDASHAWNVRDQLNIMRLLLEYGTDVNARDNEGSTPLHTLLSRSIKKPSVEAVRLLLKYGADIDAKNNEGGTALQWAAVKGYDEIAKLLSEVGGAK